MCYEQVLVGVQARFYAKITAAAAATTTTTQLLSKQ